MQTPKEKKQLLKKRLQAVLLRLPPFFVNTFIYLYPEYANQKQHVYTVANMRSMDEQVIERFEKFADLLEANKHES